jgi:hypothetical protein
LKNEIEDSNIEMSAAVKRAEALEIKLDEAVDNHMD